MLSFYISDKCPIGTFLCANSTTCMPQHSWCNGVPDCPHNDDESTENCCVFYIFFIFTLITYHKVTYHFSPSLF